MCVVGSEGGGGLQQGLTAAVRAMRVQCLCVRRDIFDFRNMKSGCNVPSCMQACAARQKETAQAPRQVL